MTALTGFIISQDSHLPAPEPAAARALAAALLGEIKGRGRDDTSFWGASGVMLAARAHRTLDLTPDGGQPFTSVCRRITVLLDGFVANAPSLRKEIESTGLRFRGHGDAELIAEGAAAWGLNRLLQKLDGCFALAVWDAEAQALHLVRDRLGGRPLYVARAGNITAFASDLNAFRALPGFEPALNAPAAAQYLAWGFVPAPDTLWKAVLDIPPAHRLMIGRDGHIPAPEAYWLAATNLEEIALRGTAGGTGAEYAARLERVSQTLARDTVRLDVPYALIDDGANASLLRTTLERISERSFRVIAVGPPDGAAVQTGFDALAGLGEPVADPRAISLLQTLRRTAIEHPVCICACALTRTDDMDDPHAKLRPVLKRIPRFLHRFLHRFLPARFAPLIDNAHDLHEKRLRLWPNDSVLPETIEPRMDAPLAAKLAFHDFTGPFCQRVMPGLDRIAALAGVELRVPTADMRVLEFGLPAPGAIDYTDAAIWLRGPLRPRVSELMNRRNLGSLGMADAGDVWQAFLGGDNSLTPRIWTLATLLAWLAKHETSSSAAHKSLL